MTNKIKKHIKLIKKQLRKFKLIVKLEKGNLQNNLAQIHHIYLWDIMKFEFIAEIAKLY